MKSLPLLIIILLSIFAFTSCKNYYVHEFSGFINGSLEAHLKLNSLTDSLIHGEFSYFKGKEVNAKVSGTLKGDMLCLNEYNSSNRSITGIFEGELNNGVYFGHWFNANRTKKAPFFFKLKEFKEDNKSSNRVEYKLYAKHSSLPFYGGLKATISGLDYILANDEWECILSTKILDFDNDGFEDILVSRSVTCGGNATAAESYFYYTFNEETGKFESAELSDCLGDFRIEMWNGHWSVFIEFIHEYDLFHKKSRYIIENRKPKLVEYYESPIIPAIHELTAGNYDAENLYPDSSDEYFLFFDLNKDGINDTIRARIWLRWNEIMEASIKLAGSQQGIEFNEANKRIGIMSNMTNGMHDIVTGFDDIYKWNGLKYVNEK
jgi:hypothetical protein